MKTTLILGASSNPSRFAYKALKKLQRADHSVILVSPNYKDIEGIPVYSDLNQVQEKVHTVTMYLRPAIAESYLEQLKELNPKRVIFNPGSESDYLKQELMKDGIEVLFSCTLIMLDAGRF